MKPQRRMVVFLLAMLALGLGIYASGSGGLSGVALAQGPRGGKSTSAAVGTGFTYQGQLKQSGALVSGSCDLQFGLWDAQSAGSQVTGTATQTVTSLVASGLFTATLDFGAAAFNGDARYLAITARCPSGGGSYTNLQPREPITPAPYALTALKTAYKNVLVVAKSGGHYSTITAALNSITDNSSTNHYLIYVAPGTYTETVAMKSYVDIEGSGELTTKITQVGSAAPNTGTVVGASNAELRFLTVENTGGNYDATPIYNNSASPRLTHVRAIASGGTNNHGVLNLASSWPMMTDVTASASGGAYSYGVFNGSSSPTMKNVAASASGGSNTNEGVHNEGSAPMMTDVTASASGGSYSRGTYNYTSSPTMTNVTASASGGRIECSGVHNDSSSPTMTSVTASASGGDQPVGVFNTNNSLPTMTNVTASASGGARGSYGIYNISSSATIEKSTIIGSGSSGEVESSGIINYVETTGAYTLTLNNSQITGSGARNNYGIYNHHIVGGVYTVLANNSQITGSSYAIRNASIFTTSVGASKLAGGPVLVNSGVVTCAGVYDEAYTFYASTCP